MRKDKNAYEVCKDIYDKTKIFFNNENHILCLRARLLQLVSQGLMEQKLDPAEFEQLNQTLNKIDEFYKNQTGHRSQAYAHFLLGNIYESHGNHTDALKEYLLSEQIYNKILIKKVIGDLSELYTKLAILGAKLTSEDITNKYLKIHVESFGLEHFRTLEIVNYLDKHGLGVL